MKYVTHPDRKVVVVMVATDEVAVGAAEVSTDTAAEVVIKVAVADAVTDAVVEEAVDKKTNVLSKRLTPIMTIRNLPRHHPEETLAQQRALREVKLVFSLNSEES
jgi:hypothetical protein